MYIGAEAITGSRVGVCILHFAERLWRAACPPGQGSGELAPGGFV